jgi:hypothetical protein
MRFTGARFDGLLNFRLLIVALGHNGLNRRERGLHLLIQLIAKDMHPFTVAFHLANVPDFESRPEDLEGVIMDWA